MLWLKRIDSLSRLVPARLVRGAGRPSAPEPLCILRPGGLGDLVLLTRAALELKLDLRALHWICERRNAPWARFLNLPHSCYDDPVSIRRALFAPNRFACVVNSEQTFGLSALYSARLCAEGAPHIGFSSNIRSDLFSTVVPYEQEAHELKQFKELLAAAIAKGGNSAPMQTTSARNAEIEAQSVPRSVTVALAGIQAPSKRLPVADWQRVLQSAEERYEHVALVGAPADLGFAKALGKGTQGRVENLVGRLSFDDVIARIRSSERLISVDSGLVHVADFFGVPSSVYFPAGNPAKWGPLSEGSMVYTTRMRASFLLLEEPSEVLGESGR